MSGNIRKLLWEILSEQLAPSEAAWLQAGENADPLERMTAFVAAPRFLSKKRISPSATHVAGLEAAAKGFSVLDWSLIRLARVWLLAGFDPSEKESYTRHVETLFDTAEMNELVALYSALPVLGYPSEWLFRATDAVRSNMGVVFDAIALRNPYPARYFPQQAWNQLVLKTIFNDKPIHYIYGLEERVNDDLAVIVSDFAHERWAAGRQVAPEVWRLMAPFMNEKYLWDMKQLFASGKPHHQEAAALACYHSGYGPARELLTLYPELERRIRDGQLTWTNLEFTELNTYVS